MKSRLHSLTVIFIAIAMMVITFGTEKYIVLFSQFVLFVGAFILSKQTKVLKRDMKIFIPFFILTSLINIIFSAEGDTVLFEVLNKSFTKEAIIYGLLFSFKLLLVIMSFSFMGVFIDSDRALSYFSSKIPKSAFMLLISFKLYPSMKHYLKNLEEVYIMRGVNLKEKKLIDRIKGILPIITVMLENSMEKAFDLGEAAYVRGFFSGRRSCYEKQKFNSLDYAILMAGVIILVIILF